MSNYLKKKLKDGKRANEEKEAMEKAAAEEIHQAAIGMYKYSIPHVLHQLLNMSFVYR